MAIQAFLEQFPQTHISIQTLSTRQLEDYLHQDLIDLAIASGEFGHGEYHSEVLSKTPAVCVVPLGHRLANKSRIHVKMLTGERILSFSETDELSVRIKAQLVANGIPDYFAIQTPSSITVCALVAAGNGIGIVSPFIAAPFSERLAVVELEPAIEIELQLALPIHTAPSKLTRMFVDKLRKQL